MLPFLCFSNRPLQRHPPWILRPWQSLCGQSLTQDLTRTFWSFCSPHLSVFDFLRQRSTKYFNCRSNITLHYQIISTSLDIFPQTDRRWLYLTGITEEKKIKYIILFFFGLFIRTIPGILCWLGTSSLWTPTKMQLGYWDESQTAGIRH